MRSMRVSVTIVVLWSVAMLPACRNPPVGTGQGLPDADIPGDADAEQDTDAEPDDAGVTDADESEDVGVGDSDIEEKPDSRELLARCLTESGAVIYGAWWCGACDYQKRMFAPYHSLLNYVDCYFDPDLGILDEMKEECVDLDIWALPTWIFGDGKVWVGTATFEQLADMSGCEWLDPSDEDCGG